MVCVGKETVCTCRVNCVREKMKEFGILEMWVKTDYDWRIELM